MPSTGRYHIIVLASNDLLDKSGVSQASLSSCSDIIARFPAGTINLIVLHPLKQRFEWSDIPLSVKRLAEMRTYGLSRKEDAYDIFGISKDVGGVAIIRPDGYIGIVSTLSNTIDIEAYFSSCVVRI